MTFRKRAILIILGIIIFSILAPTAIFFARGYRYDFHANQVIKTGTLAVKSQPRGAVVFLNEKSADTTPLVKRFLLPGEYRVMIKKDGYRSWEKNIVINSEFVISLPTGAEKIFLLRQDPKKTEIATSTNDIFLKENSLYITEGDSIFSVSANGIAKTLESKTSKIDGLADANGNNYLIQNGENLYLANESGLYPVAVELDRPKLSMDNPQEVLGINPDSQLVAVNPITGEARALRNNARDFAELDRDIYYIQSDAQRANQLMRDETKLADLENFNTSRIIITQDRQIFLLLDNTLFRVSEKLQKINEAINYAAWNPDARALIYGNEHEIWIYDTENSNANRLITRSSEILSLPVFSKELGYFFYGQANQIKALEYDFSGNIPNSYVLSEAENSLPRALILRDQKLIYQDGDSLVVLEIF